MRRAFSRMGVLAASAVLTAGCSGGNDDTGGATAGDGGDHDATRVDGSGSNGPDAGVGQDVGSDAGAAAKDATIDGGDDAGPTGTDAASDSASDGGTDSASDDGGSDAGPACVISGTTYSSGAADPANACESCQPGVTASAWSSVTDGTACGTGGICHTGACVNGCEIGGVYATTNEPDPNDTCQSCQPGTSTSMWSSLADGTGCGNGQVCAGGQCGTQCDIGDAGVVASGAANPGNACQSCQPGTSTSAWSNVANGTSCGAGDVCNAGGCVAECYIGGVFYTANETNPSNVCLSCQPATTTSDWSDVTYGSSCGTGAFCVGGGTCEAGCNIGGAVYGTGQSTNGGCELCQPTTSTTAFTNAADGKTCAVEDILTASTGACSAGTCVPAPSCPTTVKTRCLAATSTTTTSITSSVSSTSSCCASKDLSDGTYYRTYTYGDSSSYADPATVSSFRLDLYLVTVGRFRQAVNAWNLGTKGAYAPPAGSGKHTHLNGGAGLVNVGAPADAGTVYETGWVATDDAKIAPTDANLACGTSATWTTTAGTQETLPINCVNWYEAYAFCIWDGGFLPSEAEWEFAAAGGSRQLEYPWGTAAPGTTNTYAIYGNDYTGNATGIAPVGTASLGRGNSMYDLAGELNEWTLDTYGAYTASTDGANLLLTGAKIAKVVRGGAFDSGVSTLLPPQRVRVSPAGRAVDGGFRCARTP
jgi:sulfatase modifying factor 1